MTPIVADIIAVLGAVTALIVALPALVMAIRGQGDHAVNAANIKSATDTAQQALTQAGNALLHAPSPSQGGTTVNNGPGGTANVTEGDAPSPDNAGGTP